MKRVEILARGDVQRVGFRDVVQSIARSLALSGTVQNQEPYDVRIVGEGKEEALKEFVEALRIEDGPIQVRELEVRWASATGEFPYFKILRGDWQEELGERFDVAVGLLHRGIELGDENLAVSKENLAVSRMMLDKQDHMLDKQDQMLDKQDASISILQEIKADTSEIGAIREEVFATRDEARRGRDEIISTLKSGRLEEKYEQLSQEIAEIKAAIAEIRAKVS